MRASHRLLLSALIGALALAEVGTGLAAAADQRADRARAQRVAAERRAAVAYVAAVTPLTQRVFDAVQPLQDAFDAYAHPQPGLPEAEDDVLAHSGAPEELVSVRKALAALRVPATYRTAGSDLDAALAALVTATKELAAAGRSHTEARGGSYDKLVAAESVWSGALAQLTSPTQLPTPAVDGGVLAGRPAPTRGGFIHASDLACGKGLLGVLQLPRAADDAQEVLHNLPRRAQVLRSTVQALRAVRVPAGRAGAQHRLDVQLQNVLALATTMERLSAAARDHDLPALDAAVLSFEESTKTVRELGAAYRAEGVSLCALYFDVDGDGRSKQPKVSA